MMVNRWTQRLQKWRGITCIEYDLAKYKQVLEQINHLGESLTRETDRGLQEIGNSLRKKAQEGTALDEFLVQAFALVREAASRALGMRPFDVQVLASVALHQGKLV